MIKFFRNIRQNLLKENKTTKYFLYAIGEIALVVIGILIALQINNWNEEKKTKALEHSYLVQLEEEFTKLHSECIYFFDYGTAKAEYALLLLNLAKRDTIVNIHDLHVAIVHPSWIWEGNFSDDVWNEIVGNGNQLLISNTKLKTAIAKFHYDLKQFKDYQKEYSIYNMNYRNMLPKIIDPYLRFSISRSISLDNMYERFREIPGDLMTIAEVREVLNKDTKILHELVNIHTCQAYGADLMEILISDIHVITEMIQEELGVI